MEPFENFLSPDLVDVVAFHLDRHLATFDRGAFVGSILTDLENLELKARAQLMADPSPVLPILYAFRDDEEYVRCSVANHLNDIAKAHPDLVAELAKEWMEDADANRRRLVRHATRTLIMT